MQKVKLLIIIFIFPLLGIGCVCQDQKTPVDYVNAYIANKQTGILKMKIKSK